MFLGLFKQVSGNAEGYQLKKVDNCMMFNIAASATTNYASIVEKE